MRWFRKRPDRAGGGDEVVAPVALGVIPDPMIFAVKFAVFRESLGSGGVDSYVAALVGKSQLFEEALHPAELDSLDRARLALLLETVMPARKRLAAAVEACDEQDLAAAVQDLLFGEAGLAERMNNFVAAFPEVGGDDRVNKKARRAAWDFGAELLHFRAPERYPLMTSWVWDQGTLSGALRELLPDGDTVNRISFSNAPGVYQAARQWVAQQMAEHGFDREPHFAVDLFLAHVYVEYMRAMSNGKTPMNTDFSAQANPMDAVIKLLGIDDLRRRRGRRFGTPKSK